MSQVKKVSFFRFTNNEAHAFHMSVAKALNALQIDELKTLLGAYESALQELKVALLSDEGSALVKSAKQADDERDNAWRGANAYLKCAALYHPEPSVQRAAKVLFEIFEKKGNPIDLSYAAESGVLATLIEEVEKKPEEIQGAEFDRWFNLLKQKHLVYLDAFEDKAKGKSLKATGAVKDARNKCENAYEVLINMINALATLFPRPELDEFAHKVNVWIDDQKVSSKQRTASGKKDATPDGAKSME